MDANEIATLLHIAEKTLQFPNLRSIHNKALQALEGHAKEITALEESRNRMEAAKPAPELEDSADAELGTEQPEVKRREV